jgi:hypothetical protein
MLNAFVGAAAGCDLLTFKSKRSQPSAASIFVIFKDLSYSLCTMSAHR